MFSCVCALPAPVVRNHGLSEATLIHDCQRELRPSSLGRQHHTWAATAPVLFVVLDRPNHLCRIQRAFESQLGDPLTETLGQSQDATPPYRSSFRIL